MPFSRLLALIEERTKTKPLLKQAAALVRIEEVFKKVGPTLFTKDVWEHITNKAKPTLIEKETLTIAVEDAHTMSAILLVQQELLKQLQKELPELQVNQIRLHRRRGR